MKNKKHLTILRYCSLSLLLVCIAIAGCTKDDETSTGGGDNTGSSANSVVKAEYITPRITVIFSPLRAQYTIQWTEVKGAIGYNVYKSTTAGGETVTKVSDEGLTDTSFNATEIMTSNGKYVRYYWVTAVTSAGETARPANGGIKVTYTVTLQQTTMIPGGPPFYTPTYIPTGPPTSIERVIEQNPIK